MSVGKLRQGAAQPKGEWIAKSRRLAIYLRDRFVCGYCGRLLHDARPDEITLDHLTPRTNGGTNDSRNIVTACKSCNSARGAMPWRTFARARASHDFAEQTILRAIRRTVNLALARAILAGEAGDPRLEAKDEVAG